IQQSPPSVSEDTSQSRWGSSRLCDDLTSESSRVSFPVTRPATSCPRQTVAVVGRRGVEGDARATRAPGTQLGRRRYLARAGGVGRSLRVAAASVATRAGAGIRVRDRGRPFEGVKLSFAKAPHGEHEQELFKKWLAPFEQETGATVEHTIVPW